MYSCKLHLMKAHELEPFIKGKARRYCKWIVSYACTYGHIATRVTLLTDRPQQAASSDKSSSPSVNRLNALPYTSLAILSPVTVTNLFAIAALIARPIDGDGGVQSTAESDPARTFRRVRISMINQSRDKTRLIGLLFIARSARADGGGGVRRARPRGMDGTDRSAPAVRVLLSAANAQQPRPRPPDRKHLPQSIHPSSLAPTPADVCRTSDANRPAGVKPRRAARLACQHCRLDDVRTHPPSFDLHRHA
jgi:hypothetical protein